MTATRIHRIPFLLGIIAYPDPDGGIRFSIGIGPLALNFTLVRT